MTQSKDSGGMLELISQPAFCVKDGVVTQANSAAKELTIGQGDPIAPLLGAAAEEYAPFQEGCLLLSLELNLQLFSATVTSVEGQHVFLLEPQEDQPALRALALAAQELRTPMADMLAIADRLLPELEHSGDETARSQAIHMNNSLYRLMRIVFNMSDAAQVTQSSTYRLEYRNITAILEEIFEKAAALTESRGIRLNRQGLFEPVYTMVDEEKLERGVLNMISNALKHTDDGGTIQIGLALRGKRLHLSVQDGGSGIPGDVLGHVHNRFERPPGLEDPTSGLGLGMAFIRACAAAHEGSVLITHPEGEGARVNMTIAVRQEKISTLRSIVRRPDYAGERDHCLLELAESLPVELFSTDQT